MKNIGTSKITHVRYEGYPEPPYISPARDIKAWEEAPEVFPYGLVEKKQMQRLPEGLLPGDIIMLWRIGFNNFTNATVIPQYFEYRYGVDSDECIKALIKLGYAEICGAKGSLICMNMALLKKILKKNGLETGGKKEALLKRINDNFTEEKLAKEFALRRYSITPSGEQILIRYDDIIQKHGPKA